MPEVVRTVAHEGKGIDGVTDAIRQFRVRMEATGDWFIRSANFDDPDPIVDGEENLGAEGGVPVGAF